MKNNSYLCTANSCRAQIAERIVNHLFGGKIAAFAVVSRPLIEVPVMIELVTVALKFQQKCFPTQV